MPHFRPTVSLTILGNFNSSSKLTNSSFLLFIELELAILTISLWSKYTRSSTIIDQSTKTVWDISESLSFLLAGNATYLNHLDIICEIKDIFSSETDTGWQDGPVAGVQGVIISVTVIRSPPKKVGFTTWNSSSKSHFFGTPCRSCKIVLFRLQADSRVFKIYFM